VIVDHDDFEDDSRLWVGTGDSRRDRPRCGE
jgi:hypothetical protein